MRMMTILCQDPLSIVVKDEDSLDCVQSWFQQHIFKGHGGLCKSKDALKHIQVILRGTMICKGVLSEHMTSASSM